ncbi:MAG: divalent cation tolerance protein CutA [Patescibacteria group bacterium]
MKLKSINLQVSCSSLKQAKIIGDASLKQRLVACYEVYPNIKTKYFWPPRKNKVQSDNRSTLILVTLPQFVNKLQKLIKSKHSDQVPFIGLIEVISVNPAYYRWLKQELK